jgi:hypothetical protein
MPGGRWRVAIGIGVGLAFATAVVVLASGPAGGGHRPTHAGVRAPGRAGVAAAYGFPLKCLSVEISTHDPRFARADFDRSVPCGRWAGYSTAIFRRTGGMWSAVVEAIRYACPVRSLPPPVEQELGVCLVGEHQTK